MNRQATKITQAQAAIDYIFDDPNILWEALQAPGSGVLRAGSRRIPNGNKRLAIVGDRVIKLLIDSQSYDEGLTIGEMNDVLQNAEGNTNLVRTGLDNNFQDFVNRNPAHVGKHGPRTVADAVEAVIGAVYLDAGGPNGGLEAAAAVLTHIRLI